MRKIPTMFKRDPATNLRHVMNEVTPGCEWVLAGEGRPTQKFDGTCVMIHDGEMFKRREVKAGKPVPEGFDLVEMDPNTGKSVGWVSVGDGSDDKYHRESIALADGLPPDGTYELIGPKVQGNPENVPDHMLVKHGAFDVDAPRTFANLAGWLHANAYEGVVFHHEDGRMAKIKTRDFPEPPQ